MERLPSAFDDAWPERQSQTETHQRTDKNSKGGRRMTTEKTMFNAEQKWRTYFSWIKR